MDRRKYRRGKVKCVAGVEALEVAALWVVRRFWEGGGEGKQGWLRLGLRGKAPLSSDRILPGELPAAFHQPPLDFSNLPALSTHPDNSGPRFVGGLL